MKKIENVAKESYVECLRQERKLHVVLSPYHVLISNALYSDGDSMIVIGENVVRSGEIRRLVNSRFGERTLWLQSSEQMFLHPTRAIEGKRLAERFVGDQSFQRVLLYNDDDPISQVVACKSRGVVPITLVEEGIGLYRNNRHRLKSLKKVLGRALFGRQYRCLRQIGTSGYVDDILCRRPELLSPVASRVGLVPDDFTFLAESIAQTFPEVGTKEPQSMFVGQPLHEDAVMALETYLDVVESCAMITPASLRPMRVKPHPREDLSKYGDLVARGLVILENTQDMPFEAVCPDSDQSILYTISSSSAIHAAANTKSSVFCLAPLVGEDDFPRELFTLAGVRMADSYLSLSMELEGRK